MNNDNNNGDTPTEEVSKTADTVSNVIDIKSRAKVNTPAQTPTPEAKATPARYEFHFFPAGVNADGSSIPGEVEEAYGYLKFGPQFLAVVEGPEDTANVIFTVATGTVKYIKQLGKDSSIQGTLSV